MEKLNTGNYGWDLFMESLTNCCKTLGLSKQSQRTETVDLNQSKLEAEFVRNSYVQENTGFQPKIKKHHRIRTYPQVLFLSY